MAKTAESKRAFGSSPSCAENGFRRSDNDESLRQKAALERRISASGAEQMTGANLRDSQGAAAADVSSRETVLDAGSQLGEAEGILPIERMPAELRDMDWGSKMDRKLLVERLLQGKLDLFGGSNFSDTDVTQHEMEQWQENFRMKVVDVNRTSRGSPTGGIGRFSALVVVGNSNGVLGLGSGKALAISDAVKKANRQALKTLFFVPRYRSATILHPVVARYGKCKVTMYPRSTGSGCKASDMISGICKLAGIQDIGVKVHGTRNVRNTVKALIRGFESQTVEEELRDVPSLPGADVANRAVGTSSKGQPSVKAVGLSA